ncbi:MAG TPA: LCP family protein [Trebonia sp.]|nr:LCP family protein [Trebonia sp.]
MITRRRWFRWPGQHRRLLAWTGGILALLLVAGAAGGYAVLRHLNGNIPQADVHGLLGRQPPDAHPQAENILVIGSDSRAGVPGAAAEGLTTDRSDTMMVIHIPASRQWAEVMSVPRDSWVPIPACTMGNGASSAPVDFKINQSFAIGNLHGNKTAMGAACTIKTVEQDTGIYIDHFIVIDFDGFKGMVAALGGVEECNPVAITDPNSKITLSAGSHLLTPDQALAYVRARYGLGDGSDLERIGRQQAFMTSLISRARSELYNPLAMYRFLDAATRSVTIDSQLGGVRGLYDLEQSLHGIPPGKITMFTLPTAPRSTVVPGDTANVVWTPASKQVFASLRDDVLVSPSLLAATQPAATPGRGGPPAASPSPSGPSAGPSATPAPSATSSPGPGTHRTANQSICVG